MAKISQRIRNMSIKNKLTALILIVSFVTTSLVSYIQYSTTVAMYRNNFIDNTITDAKLISKYCTMPLEYRLPEGAREVFEKFKIKQHITNIVLLDKHDSVFYQFNRDQILRRVPLENFTNANYYVHDDYLHVLEPVIFGGEVFGKVYLRVHTGLRSLSDDLMLNTLLLVMSITFLSLLMAFYLQRFISIPLQKIAETTQQIAETKDYKVQLTKKSEDEIGKLIFAFNTLLKSVQQSEEERDTALQTLSANEKIYRTIFEKSTDAIFLVDTKTGRYLEANSGAEKLTGYSKEEILAHDASSITSVPWEYRLKRLQNASQPVNFGETIYTRKNGTKRVGILSSIGINESIIFDLVHDISERKAYELELQKLSRAIDNSPLSIVITDGKGIIEYVNPYFTQSSGYMSIEVIGKPTSIFKSGYHDEQFYKNMWETISSGAIWSSEIYNKKRNGELYWESIAISPIYDSQWQIVNFVAIKDDITKDKQLLAELIEAKENAEEMSRLKSNFLANMSHELRTPMNGILGFAAILQDMAEENEEMRRIADMLFKSGKRLTETLNLILDLSRIEAGKLELTLDAIDLVPMILESINMYRANAEKKNLYINHDDLPKSLTIYADERIVRDILNNLINNAVKFTFEGGVHVSLVDSDKTDEIIFTVTDTGIGIPEDARGVIFEEFRQVSEGRSRAFEGTGLGLALSKKFANKLGGNIIFESTPGIGSTFMVKLPKRSRPVTESLPPLSGSGHKVADTVHDEIFTISKPKLQYKILLVENDDVNQIVIIEYLKPLYDVDIVLNGTAALDATSRQQYDAILMDINLGVGMNGIEATQELRKRSNYVNTPIIAITAFAMKGDREEFLSKGCSEYLSKPFKRHELLQILAKFLP